MLRDGRSSIGPVLLFAVELAGGEWPRLQDTAERFATAERWAIDGSNEKDKARSQFRFVGACVEPGSEIRFDGEDMPNAARAHVSVFQPQGGNSWQGPAGRLLASIEAAFPGRLRLGWSGTEVQTPSTLLPQR